MVTLAFLIVSQYRLYYQSGNQILGDIGGGFAFLSLFPVRSHLGAQCQLVHRSEYDG